MGASKMALGDDLEEKGREGRAGEREGGSVFTPSTQAPLPCRDAFNIQVLHAFVGLHEFTDLNLVQALR